MRTYTHIRIGRKSEERESGGMRTRTNTPCTGEGGDIYVYTGRAEIQRGERAEGARA